MPKWIMKLSHHGGQARLTIPKDLVIEMKWLDVQVVQLERLSSVYIGVRGFGVAEERKDDDQRDRSGKD